MKKKALLVISGIMYLFSIVLLGYYFLIEFSKNFNLSPSGRVVLLLFICFLMYIGGIILSKNINEKYKDKPLKINLIIWLILYIILLFTLTIFDDYFYRSRLSLFNWNNEIFRNYINHSFNIIPLSTISLYITEFISGDIALYIFVYNILGNIIALMPFAFFLPILFKRQEKFRNFLFTILGIALGIELLQFITLSGCCDIDDVILNTLGACLMYGVLQIKPIKGFIKDIFLRI